MLQSSDLSLSSVIANTDLTARSRPGIRVNLVPAPSNPTVSVIIPTLNEAKNLPHVLPLIPEWVNEIILVDGHSTDDTLEVARSLIPNIRIVMQEGRGKGGALRQGFAAATGDIIVMIDADGSTDPGEIPAFVGALVAGADFAKGSRFVQGGGTADMEFHRKLGNWGFVVLSRLLFGGKYTDLCYGYNAFWRHVLPSLDLQADGFEIETEMNLRALAAKLRVIEVGSFEHPRRFGVSNLHAIRDGLRVLRSIGKEFVRYRRAQHVAHTAPQEVDREAPAQPVQVLLSEALHFVLHGNHDLSPEAVQTSLQAVQKSLSAVLHSGSEADHAEETAPRYGGLVDHQFVIRLEYLDSVGDRA